LEKKKGEKQFKQSGMDEGEKIHGFVPSWLRLCDEGVEEREKKTSSRENSSEGGRWKASTFGVKGDVVFLITEKSAQEEGT